jgi:hypothetical protein
MKKYNKRENRGETFILDWGGAKARQGSTCRERKCRTEQTKP